jgi:hypothetical protein
MNWPLAIARNRTALLAIVAGIAALIGGHEGGMITRRLRNAALALLRPAESAARRLIVMAARGVVAPVCPARAFRSVDRMGGEKSMPVVSRPPAFRLFDPRKRYRFRRLSRPPRGVPRIRSFWHPPPIATASATPARPGPETPVASLRLTLRVAALERALADLPRQARRLARWRMRESARLGTPPRRPLRLGHPPGWRTRGERAVDLVLSECHRLALDVLAGDPVRPDTS